MASGKPCVSRHSPACCWYTAPPLPNRLPSAAAGVYGGGWQACHDVLRRAQCNRTCRPDGKALGSYPSRIPTQEVAGVKLHARCGGQQAHAPPRGHVDQCRCQLRPASKAGSRHVVGAASQGSPNMSWQLRWLFRAVRLTSGLPCRRGTALAPAARAQTAPDCGRSRRGAALWIGGWALLEGGTDRGGEGSGQQEAGQASAPPLSVPGVAGQQPRQFQRSLLPAILVDGRAAAMPSTQASHRLAWHVGDALPNGV